MEKIKVVTGRKKYEVVNEHDEHIGEIEIDPKDFAILGRMEKGRNEIDEIIGGLKNIKVDDAYDAVSDASEKIKKILNMVFDYDVSASVFGNANCLSIHNGETFAERFLGAVIPVIDKIVSNEKAAINKRIGKYKPNDRLEKRK